MKKIIKSVNFTRQGMSKFKLYFFAAFLMHNVAYAQEGQLDFSFDPGTGANNAIFTTSIQPGTGGKIIVGGTFNSFNGSPVNYFLRLNSDGTVDNSFNIGTAANLHVYAIAMQPDGKILLGGSFTTYNGIPVGHVVRLHGNGQRDMTFTTTGVNNPVLKINIQKDGKILLSGTFDKYLARLNSNGTIDNTLTFTGTYGPPIPGANNSILAVGTTSNEQILIGGQFTEFSSISQNRIARIHKFNGMLDGLFNVGTGVNNAVRDIAVQKDDKIIIVGDFTSYNGTTRNRIARINTDGSLDNSFNP